jgi:hypothetical protein
VPSENINSTYAWLKEQGFMATREQTEDLKVRERGLSDGRAAGSWVIDGNTSDETCAEILRLMADCAWEGPELRLGEWADDPSFGDILDAAGVAGTTDGEYEDDLFFTYQDAWYEGVQREVERACLARVTPDVTQPLATDSE